MIGDRFGRYVILDLCEIKPKSYIKYVKCICDCGITKNVRLSHLKSGKIVSCGCYSYEMKTSSRTGIAGKISDTNLYSRWSAMKNRLHFGKYKSNYIQVCKEWHYFKNFKEWAENSGYEESLSLDRVDNLGDYCPSNCRWIPIEYNVTEMLNHHFRNSTGQFSKESILKLTNTNRDELGAKFKMYFNGILLDKFNCLMEAALFIKTSKGLDTEAIQIKKNISACLHGKRKTCHGYTFEWLT